MKIDNSIYGFLDCNICFLGIPKIVSFTPNPLNKKGPDLLRFAINNKDDFDNADGKCCFDELKICDEGNLKNIKEIASKLNKQVLFIFGGEHSITKDCFLELNNKVKDLAIVVFDAHMDVRETGEENACFLKSIIEKVGAKNVYLIGQRVYSKEEYDYVKSKGIMINNLKGLKDKKLYISFDIDAIDSVYVPSCSTPEPFGESLKYYNDLLIKIIKENELVAIDFVEFSGKSFDITYSNIASIIMNLLKELKRKNQ
ncbi:MAG: arginase family protein [Candidatus Nanoarchaeia archaeon]|nr:arginase family protein [Candidatus Nanoarchaeia archaeon]